jgi:magnesium transporter
VEEEKGKLASTMIGGYRRKAIVTLVKTWMVVSAETGEARVEDVDKYSIMRRTGLPARDLRVLDPHLSNPSSILGRERAIVVNLEHIKAIITSTEVLMINSSNPFFLRFLQDLQARVPPINDVKMRTRISNDVVDGDCEAKPLLDERTPLFQSRDDCDDSSNNASEGIPDDSSNNVSAAPKQLPFEFKALEACIESACTCLECEVSKILNFTICCV